MPATARIALPLVLSLIAYVIYHGSGVKEHGPFGYIKHALIVPGLPFALHFPVVPIEFISKFLLQPFSPTVRPFANLLAAPIPLVTFATLSSALSAPAPALVTLPLPPPPVPPFPPIPPPLRRSPPHLSPPPP